MFKGIRLKHFLLTLSMIFASSLAYGLSRQEQQQFVNEAMKLCKKYNGSFSSEIVDEGTVTCDSDNKNCVLKNRCVSRTCTNADSYVNGNESGDAGVSANQEKICADYNLTSQGNEGGVSGGTIDGYIIDFEGQSYICKRGEDKSTCLGRYRVRLSGSLVCATSSGSNIACGCQDGDVVYETGNVCEVKKRVWWKLWLGKSWVETDCDDIRGSTRRESDISVSEDIDEDIRIRTTRRGAPGKSTSRRGGSSRSGDSGSRRYRYIYDEATGARMRCSYNMDDDECIEEYYRRTGRTGDSDADGCYDCERRRRRTTSTSSSGGDSWASIIAATGYAVGNVLTPYLGYRASSKWANAMYKSNQAWADSCASVQNNFIDGYSSSLDWYSQNELTVGTDYASSYYGNMPTCNGQAMGAYAGMQGFMGSGFGTFGSMYGSAGYSNAFLGAMAGPYAMGNYGLGINVSGGLGGLGVNGLGYGNLGINGLGNYGLIGGPNFGIGAGTFGYGTNGLGLNAGVNLGFNTGLNGLYAGNAGNYGLYASAYPQYSSVANGLVPWNTGGGYYMNGGVNSSAAAMYANQSQVSAGSYYQQQALADKANTALQNYYSYPYSGSSYYSGAAYSPFNVGIGLSAGVGVMI